MVDLAGVQPGQLVRQQDPDASFGHSDAVSDQADDLPRRAGVRIPSLEADHERVVVTGAHRREAVLREQSLDLLEVDPVPEDLEEPAAAPHQLVETGTGTSSEVTRVQPVHGPPGRQVLGPLGVPEHHVGPAVHQLADAGIGVVGHRLELEAAAGDRAADRCRVRVREVRGGTPSAPSPRSGRT